MSINSKCPICGHYDDWCNELKGQNGKLYGCHRKYDFKVGEIINGFDGKKYIMISSKNNVGVFEEENQLNSAKEKFKTAQIGKKQAQNYNFIKKKSITLLKNKNGNMGENGNEQKEIILDKINKVYTYFLSLNSELSGDAILYLKSNGWDDNLIKNCNFKSALNNKNDKKKICEKIEKKFGKISQIPGFFYKENQLTYKIVPSILIPNYDIYGRIISITIKPLNSNLSKYYYFSSKDKDGGRGAINNISCYLGEKRNKIFLTEGQKKAFVFNQMFNISSFSISGVTNYHQFFERSFLSFLRKNKVNDVIIGFDSDYKMNPSVKKCLMKTASNFEFLGFNVYILDWDVKYKGIDDLLLSGNKPRVIRIEDIK